MTSIDTSSWKEFKLSELFEIASTKSLDEGKLSFVPEGVNFVGRVGDNNGVKGKIDKQDFEPNEPFTITATVIGNYKYVRYQEEPYYCSQNITKLKPKFKINKQIALFMITSIQKFVSKYDGQQGGYKLEDLKNFIIKLPVREVEGIDFEYMENYIRELESERIRELESERIRELEDYLIVTGLNDYELTEEDKQILSLSTKTGFNKNSNTKNVIPNGLKMKLFSINNLFKLQKVFNKLSKENLSDDFEFPTYSSDSKNNGILGYSEKPEFICDDKIPVYVIFGDHTRTLNIARKSFSVLDNVKVLIPCINNDDVLLYIISLWGMQIPNLGYSRHWKVAKECKLPLPIKVTKDGEPLIDKEYKYHEDGFIPDFEYMEKYIRVIEKKVIKNIYDDKGLILSVIKKIVNEVRYDK